MNLDKKIAYSISLLRKAEQQREIFFGTLVAKAQTAKNPTDLVQALCKLASSTSEAA